jgi:GNAT superfamily N-acetyltransferase
MKPNKAQIIDITEKAEYEKQLYRCLAPMPFRKYKQRHEYLCRAIPKGFRKKLLVFNGDVVGTIEYAPADASGFPIRGDNIVAMHCIWVLRRAKGHNFGKQLLNDMITSEKNATGFATIALENHWSPWMRKDQMERLGFRAIDAFKVRHKTKHPDQCFTMYFMWLPMAKNAKPPKWDKTKLLEGVHFCTAHPLYHPASLKLKEIYEKC